MTQNFNLQLKNYQTNVNQTLAQAFPADSSRAAQAARYSLDAGGKRLRPMLATAFYQAFTGVTASPTVCQAILSLEYIHTFSLIHDDLPALDNDDLRRGQPTCHRQFDEATAILAGDYLLNLAYWNLGQTSLPPALKAALTHTLATATQSLLAGEMLDIEGEQRRFSDQELQLMFAQKTGALFQACFLFALQLAAAPASLAATARQLGYHLGLAFQIQDDVLDITGDEKSLGKKVHKDASAHKNTWVAHFGLAEAKFAYKRHYHQTIKLLTQILPPNPHCDFLLALITYLERRQS